MHWTISRLKDYETCPKKYEYKYLLGVKEPGPKSPALARGIEWHSSIEQFLLGNVQALPTYITPLWMLRIDTLRKYGASAEEQWEFEEGWHPYTNSGSPLWLRMKLDANYRVKKNPNHHVVIDFKTGKHYPSNAEQNEVYAIGAFAKFDDVDVVETELWYLDSDEPYEKTYHRKDVSKLARKWESRSERMLEAKEFPAHPGRACSWCPFKGICPNAA